MAREEEDWASEVCSHCLRQAQEEPYFLRVRRHLQWWKAQGVPQLLLEILEEGIPAPQGLPQVLTASCRQQASEDQVVVQEILAEYSRVGAIKKVTEEDGPTRYLVPWFVVQKKEGSKIQSRLITDCRKINQFYCTQHFKLDHLENIFPFLQKGMFAAKVDLKNAYFHLELHRDLKAYIRLQVGEEIWEFQSACCGISTSHNSG